MGKIEPRGQRSAGPRFAALHWRRQGKPACGTRAAIPRLTSVEDWVTCELCRKRMRRAGEEAKG